MTGNKKPEPPITFDEAKLFLLAMLTGALVVPVIMALSKLTRLHFETFLRLEDILSPYLGPVWILPPMLLAGLLIGLLVHKFGPESEGPGIHVVIAAFHRLDGKLRLRTGITKFVATIITVGTGTPNGLVSPSTLLGNSVSTLVARLFRIDEDTRKTLSLCGVAAAISVIIGAPLGAAIFAVEVVYGDRILYRRFFFCLVSSLSAYLIAVKVGFRDLFPNVFTSAVVLTPEILAFVVLTVLVTVLVNVVYIHIYQMIHDFFLSWSWKGRNWLEPAMGMGLAALLMAPSFGTLIEMGVVGGGYTNILLSTEVNIVTLSVVIMTVILGTAFVTGSGGSGGLFMPIMFLGNLLGLLMVAVISRYHGFSYPVILAAAGISASLCTTLNIPLASVIISVELFGPVALVPSMIGALGGYTLGKRYLIFHEIRWKELRELRDDTS